jgi:dephospho-CoA kinase
VSVCVCLWIIPFVSIDGPLRVALTGGIATGKSHVLRLIADRGVPTIDADVLSRQVVQPGTPGFDAVRQRFGDRVVDSQGQLDRRRLGEIVFDDDNARRSLEGIVHPAVYEAIAGWWGELARAGAAMGVADIPLLFETGREGDFQRVIVAACAPETQRARLMARDNLSEDEADRRLAAQWPIATKASRADFVIDTDGTFEETHQQVLRVLERLSDDARALARP